MRARSLLAVLCVVALVSAWVRVANNLRLAEVEDAGGRPAWFATDPDSLYHMRRLERALDSGGWIDPRDPLLDHPTADGAPIPWPPTYTRVLWAASAPFAPDDAELRRAFVERTTATAPAVISVLTSVLVALAAARLAGVGAGLIAGLLHAVNFASMRYSHLGIGDHHAWISLLHVAWLAAAAEGLRALDRPRLALRWGALAGLFAGAGLTSWVAALLLVVLSSCDCG
ncbi:MAG: hypothetical protein O2816_20220 [Planctomycetota bacterium]|nr:hypothetical protein [Planctomycetota bacterium]